MNTVLENTRATKTSELAGVSVAGQALPWYAVQVRSNAEAGVSVALQSKGYEQFFPTYRKLNRWSDRVKKLDLPLFPGYVFCRMNITLRRPVITIPGVLNVIGFGKQFVSIPEDQIQAVQEIVRSGLMSIPWPFLKEGQRIAVRTGALKSMEGFLVHARNKYRVVVSIPILQRSVAVEIDRDWIEPIQSAGRTVGC